MTPDQKFLARVKAIRAERDCGVLTARDIAVKETLIARIESARTVEELRPVLLRIVEML